MYDNSCNLHDYCLNRDPGFFKNTKFFVDRFHWVNHKGLCWSLACYILCLLMNIHWVRWRGKENCDWLDISHYVQFSLSYKIRVAAKTIICQQLHSLIINGKFMKGLPVSLHTTCRSLDFCGVQISLLKDRWKINLWIVFGLMFIMVDSLYCCLLPCVMILLFLDCSTGYDIRTFERYAGLNTQVRIIVTNIWLSLHLVYHHQLNITITRYRICGPLKYCLISGLGFSSFLNIHNDITNIPLQHGKSRHFVVV